MDDFADDYDITNDPNDFVSSEELQRWTDNNERGYSFKKFLKELTTYTARYPNVKKKQQTSGARRRGYSGIKKIQRDDLFESATIFTLILSLHIVLTIIISTNTRTDEH